MLLKSFLILLLLHFSFGLYEDQAGKFDWYQRFVGKIKYYFIEKQNVPSRRIILTSENNVHAALNLYSGNIEWRQHLKENDNILSVDYCKNHLISVGNISGSTVMRVWDTIIGTILWEKQITENEAIKSSVRCNIDSENFISLIDTKLYSIKLKNGNINWSKDVKNSKQNLGFESKLVLTKSMDVILITEENKKVIDVQIFNTSGEFLSIPQSPFTFSLSRNKCDAYIQNNILFCLDLYTAKLNILYFNRPSLYWQSVNVILPFTSESEMNTIIYEGIKLISTDKLMVILSDTMKADNQQSLYIYNLIEDGDSIDCSFSYKIDNIKTNSIVEQDGKQNLVSMRYHSERKIKNIELNFIDLRNGHEIKHLTNQYTLHKHHGKPVKMEPVLFRKKDNALAYRLFLVTTDNALHFWNQNGNILWMREESLADIVAVEMLDLPVSDTEAKMDEEFGHNQDNVFQKFIKRISTQLSQLKYFLQEQLKQSKSPSSRYYSKDKSCQDKDNWNCRSEEDSIDNIEIANVDNSSLTETHSNIATTLRRDSFNLHKMLVLTTGSGKIFGMKSSTGQIVWRYLISNAIPFKGNRVQLFILRTTAHFPHPPQAVLLMRCANTSYPLIFTFNPITGSPQTPEPQILEYQIFQATMLPLPVSEENTYSKPVLILDRDLRVHIFPSTYRLSLDTYPIFLYRIDDGIGNVIGYEVKRNNLGTCASEKSNDHDCYVAYEIWRLNFSQQDQKIAAVAFRSPIEQVHSVGRILSDRNVLYKYLNPNLLSLVTENKNSSNQNCAVTVYLIDVVTGKIVYSTVHKKASGPINLVQSENWIVYSFQNLRSHRTEIVVLELYEPYEIPDSIIYEIKDVDIEQLKRSIKSNRNDVGGGFDILSILGGERATTKKFSSKQRSRIETAEDIITGPVVLKQGYIVGTYIRRASVSITEKGITSKSVLLALESGGIMELPKALLDPRRNFIMTPELIEEGVEPYMPEIPLRTFNIINYNHSVARVKSIYAGPSGLESTSLIFVYGLDLFFTQVAPSKMYDILKEDFDYVFIATVTVGMIVGAFVTQRLAARRALYRSWQ